MKTLVPRAMLWMALAAGCGPVGESAAPAEAATGQVTRAIEDDNGLTPNGLAFNGLAFNGLAFNGLAFNGLAFNGLSSPQFASWFQQHPSESNDFMKYLVRCAVPEGQTRSYTLGSTTYEWPGSLGLAPGWANGAAATLEEQQVVSACLAALTNKYGRSVLLSVQGTNARGVRIPTTSGELADFPLREACFFGNLFTGEGLFVGNDQIMLRGNQTSLRACALMGKKECEPLVHVGSCHEFCQHDATGTYFARCTRGGISYHALSTRLRPQEIYICGDGRCQFPETCARNNASPHCKQDCGTCD
ncbi:hypothetical protein [Cystobacter ferrugineus]|uniref:hypothetical protein n=1 Tax=Cystobacter ferrugineus TaxID=83449 RepID=UPI000A75C966|nr:hypothetical protein [Cystobacter ferrugineus]